jgi:sigma-B regulation protein RsbU (phosphoserine phosphatase)
MNVRVSDKNVAHQLAVQIESLHGEFRKLSKAATPKELANQFAAVLSGVFPNTRIDVLHRPGHDEQWRILHQGGPESAEHLLSSPDDLTSSACYLDKTSRRMCAVLRLADESEAGIVLTQQSPKKKFSDIDASSLRIFLQLFDNAYQPLLHRRKEKELVFALNHRVLQLNSLIDTGIEVSKLYQRTSPHQLALERAASLTNASKGLVRMTSKKAVKEETFFPVGEQTRKVEDPSHCITSSFKFGGKTYTFKLFEKESRHGILPFEETDQLLLDALARQVHASLENRYLHQQELEKQKIEREISVAASIQQRILPEALPVIDGYDIAGINIPSKLVGGDYFDCISLPDGRYALVMADVAGKGMPAALLVSSLHAYLSAYLETYMSLVELAGRLNKVICRTSTPEKFITAFIALLTPGTGYIEAVNAGHNPVYWMKNDGTIQELKASGVPFGMLDLDLPYQNEQIRLGKGERVLMYTDGITEAMNERQQLYDTCVPLKEFVIKKRQHSAKEFIDALISDIKRFSGAAAQADDITALYLIRS